MVCIYIYIPPGGNHRIGFPTDIFNIITHGVRIQTWIPNTDTPVIY